MIHHASIVAGPPLVGLTRPDRPVTTSPGPVVQRRTLILDRGESFAGPDAREIAIVDSGTVSLQVATPTGVEFCLRLLKAGDIVVPLDLIATSALLLFYRGEEPARIRWPYGQSAGLHDAAEAERVLLHAVTDLLGGCIRMIHELACLPAPHRLYCELLRLAGWQVTRTFALPTQANLAARLCTTRETISREFSFLRRNGVIAGSRDVRIVNPDFLLSRVAAALHLADPDAVWQAIGSPRG